MAGMSTALTEFADNGDSRTYTYTGHTVLSPKIVIQKRRVPQGNQKVAEDSVNVLVATKDATDVVLPQKVSFMVTVRRPIDGTASDVTAALATFRDVVAGDEFGSVVNTQNWLKA